MTVRKARNDPVALVKMFIPTRFRRYLTARVAVAFIIFLAVSIFFVWLAKEVRDLETLTFDRWVLLHIRELSYPGLDRLMAAITDFGGVAVVPAVTLALAALLYAREERENAWLVLVGVIGASVINLVLKVVFARQRPDLWEHIVTERSFSFPSGHAMASMSLAASIVAAAWFTRWRKLVISLGMIYITVVGFTRLYLGVHYPTDIVAGWIISLGWVAVVWVLFADAPARTVGASRRKK